MSTRVRSALVLATVLLLCMAAIAYSHGGGLDSQGGHHDRKSGGYHFHRGPLAGRSFSSKSDASRALTAPSGEATKAQTSTVGSSSKTAEERTDALVQLLIRKGVITEHEWQEALK